jgi:hypothetical protein
MACRGLGVLRCAKPKKGGLSSIRLLCTVCAIKPIPGRSERLRDVGPEIRFDEIERASPAWFEHHRGGSHLNYLIFSLLFAELETMRVA